MQKEKARCQDLSQQSHHQPPHSTGPVDTTWVRDLQQQLSQQEGLLAGLRRDNHTLHSQLATQTSALENAQASAAAAGRVQQRQRPPPSSFVSNKKNEDDAFDIEAAMLTGESPPEIFA